MHTLVVLNLKLFYFSIFFWEYQRNRDSLLTSAVFWNVWWNAIHVEECLWHSTCTVPTNLLAWLQKLSTGLGAIGWLIAFFQMWKLIITQKIVCGRVWQNAHCLDLIASLNSLYQHRQHSTPICVVVQCHLSFRKNRCRHRCRKAFIEVVIFSEV